MCLEKWGGLKEVTSSISMKWTPTVNIATILYISVFLLTKRIRIAFFCKIQVINLSFSQGDSSLVNLGLRNNN